MSQLFRAGAVTDEFSSDLETAVDAMAELGMTGAELRSLWGKNIIDLSDAEVDSARRICSAKGLEIVSIASPLLKCTLPGSAVDSRFQQDSFASKHTFEDQPSLSARAFEIAHRTGARIVRVFSYWRTIEPEKCFDAVTGALRELAEKAAKEDLTVGLENEFACNVATAAETARVLAAVGNKNLQVVWDPANGYMSGEIPYPDGYRKLPPNRIAHVHAKDCYADGRQPPWGPLGEGAIDWRGQISALAQDGYRGWFSLETHWRGPHDDKMEASQICGRNLKRLLSASL